ncbi:MAG: hypothetical protein KDA22_14025 [Phycisphaerales bacterium]|nr:hypothetical protein [Phycisphaerales bacterium]
MTARIAGAAVLGCCVLLGGASASEVAVPPAPAAPDVETVVLAWTTARGWLDAMALPAEEAPEAAVELPDVRAISVLIRRSGEVVARGEWTEGGPLGLRRAMSRAIGELYGDPGLRRLLETAPAAMAPRLTLEVECAGEPVPVLGRTFEEVGSRIQPGIDGLAMRRESRWSFAFPGRLLAANSAKSPTGTFASMAVELGLAARDLSDLRRTEPVEVYRLPTTRLVQVEPGGTPLALLRLDELVRIESVTRESIRQLADHVAQRIADHVLFAHPVPGPRESRLPAMVRGDYHPVADEYRPLEAGPFDQWLVAFVLLRHANAPTTDALTADHVRTAAREWVLQAATPGEGVEEGVTFASDRAAAMAVLACSELGERFPTTDAVVATALAQLRAPLDGDPPHGLDASLTAAALARAAQNGVPGVTPADAASAIERAWAATPAREHGSMLPWIVMAEEWAGTARQDAGPDRLARLQAALLSAQSGAASGAPLDLRGGFPLAGQPDMASARSLPALAGLAFLLGRPEPSPQRSAEIWAGQLAALRFVMQLAVRSPFEQLYRDPERVAWGIRASPWDSDQATAAQAMGLLTLGESLRHWPPVADSDRP